MTNEQKTGAASSRNERPGWQAFIDFADETNVFLHGLPEGLDFSSENKNEAQQTPLCYAMFANKKTIGRAIADAYGWDECVDMHGFCAEDYSNATNPVALIQERQRELDRLSLSMHAGAPVPKVDINDNDCIRKTKDKI